MLAPLGELPQRPAGGSTASGQGTATIAALLIVLVGVILLEVAMTLDLAADRKSQLLLVAVITVVGGGYWLARTLGLISPSRNNSSDGGADFGLSGSSDGGSCDAGGDGGGDGGGD